MKNSTITALFSAACMLTASVATADTPTFDWGNLFDGDTAAGDNSEGLAIASDGNIYWHNIGGSTQDAPDIRYAGEVLFEGALYNAGTSYNGNLCILKTDSDGKALWNLHSESCDFASNDGRVVATSDGGVIFTARLRHTDGMLDTSFTLVDGTGQKHEFEWKVERRYYRVLVGRISAQGSLTWAHFIDCDTAPAPAASGNYADFTADAISVPALAIDDKDNFYIGGNFRSEMTVPTADGSIKFAPRNVSSWNGDSQQNAGGMFLLKFDGNGYYTANLPVEGVAQKEIISNIVWDNGALYFQALINCAENQGELTVAGEKFTPEGAFSPIVGKLNEDLTVDWLSPMKGETVGGKYGFQNCSITVCDNNLWFTGMFNGAVYDAEGNKFFESTQGNMREGFLAKMNVLTGACVSGVSSRASFAGNVLTGYLKAVQSPYIPTKVYVYGYGMNANTGIFIREYDTTTLESSDDKVWTLASGGGVPTALACEMNSKTREFYFTGRGNNSFNCSGTTIDGNSKWAVLMACYTLPEEDFPTAVGEIYDNTPALEIAAGKGYITMTSEKVETVEVYDISGCRVASVVVDGSVNLPLPTGFYIAAGRKVLVK